MSPASSVERKPRGCTHFRSRQLQRLLSRHYDAALAPAGLKTTQYSLLGAALHLGPVAPGELARQMALNASTLTRNLQPLLAAGWLHLGDGPDGRTRSVTLTAAGRAKHAEAQRCWKSAQLGLNARLGPDRVAALHELIDECVDRLEAGTAP